MKDIIKETVVSTLNYRIEISDITDETNLLNDLNIDSLAYVQIIIELEEKFNIEMDDEIMDLDAMQIYNNFVNAIIKEVSKKNTGMGGEL